MVQELLTILGTSAILVSALAWLAKTITAHFLNKDVEKFKEQLKAASTLELEKLRSELSRQALEHEVKYRRIDQNVGEHLNMIYQLLFDLYSCTASYVKELERENEPSKREKLAQTIEASKKFNEYFAYNRMYVPPKLSLQIADFARLLTNTSNNFTSGIRRDERRQQQPNRPLEEQVDDMDHWFEAYEAVQNQAAPMFNSLIKEIQKRLGVTDDDTDDSVPAIKQA